MEKTLTWYEKRIPHLDVADTEDKCFSFALGILNICDQERGETRKYMKSLAKKYFKLTDEGQIYDGDFTRWCEAIRKCDVKYMTDKRKAIEELVTSTFLLWGGIRDCAGEGD